MGLERRLDEIGAAYLQVPKFGKANKSRKQTLAEIKRASDIVVTLRIKLP